MSRGRDSSSHRSRLTDKEAQRETGQTFRQIVMGKTESKTKLPPYHVLTINGIHAL